MHSIAHIRVLSPSRSWLLISIFIACNLHHVFFSDDELIDLIVLILDIVYILILSLLLLRLKFVIFALFCLIFAPLVACLVNSRGVTLAVRSLVEGQFISTHAFFIFMLYCVILFGLSLHLIYLQSKVPGVSNVLLFLRNPWVRWLNHIFFTLLYGCCLFEWTLHIFQIYRKFFLFWGWLRILILLIALSNKNSWWFFLLVLKCRFFVFRRELRLFIAHFLLLCGLRVVNLFMYFFWFTDPRIS